MRAPSTPRGVWIPALFFVLSGLIETGMALWEMPAPLSFWPVWDAVGRGALHLALAYGLWKRIALFRSAALVYCLAVLATYGAVLVIALAHEPVRYPASVVVQSLFQVPSCVLLFPHLRSPSASLLFPYPLFRRVAPP